MIDAAEFFYDDEFAVNVTYLSQTGSRFTVLGNFDEDYYSAQAGGIAVASNQPRFTAPSNSFLVDPAEGDELIYNGTQYRVLDPEPDGTGITELLLEVKL